MKQNSLSFLRGGLSFSKSRMNFTLTQQQSPMCSQQQCIPVKYNLFSPQHFLYQPWQWQSKGTLWGFTNPNWIVGCWHQNSLGLCKPPVVSVVIATCLVAYIHLRLIVHKKLVFSNKFSPNKWRTMQIKQMKQIETSPFSDHFIKSQHVWLDFGSWSCATMKTQNRPPPPFVLRSIQPQWSYHL